MQNGGSLQCSINACVAERGERARGAGVDFTGQELSLYSGKKAEREKVYSTVGGGATSAWKRSCGDGEGRSVKVRG